MSRPFRLSCYPIVGTLVVGTLALACCQHACAETDIRNLTAAQILDRTYEVYATCKSYSDSGVATNTRHDVRGKRTYAKTFQTAFVRPQPFRFQYTYGDLTYIVWMNRDDVQQWWTVSLKAEKKDSLGSALAESVGVSSTTSVIVPSLLLPETVRMRRLIADDDSARIEDAKIGDANCFRLTGTRHSWHKTTVWIDAATFLVRRIEMDGVHRGVGRELTVTFDPTVNEEIDKTKLEFNHP